MSPYLIKTAQENSYIVILLIENNQTCLLKQAVTNVLTFNLERFRNIMLKVNARRWCKKL